MSFPPIDSLSVLAQCLALSGYSISAFVYIIFSFLSFFLLEIERMRSGLGALEVWSCSLAQREIVQQFVDMVKIAMRFQLSMYSVAGIYTGELHPA